MLHFVQGSPNLCLINEKNGNDRTFIANIGRVVHMGAAVFVSPNSGNKNTTLINMLLLERKWCLTEKDNLANLVNLTMRHGSR